MAGREAYGVFRGAKSCPVGGWGGGVVRENKKNLKSVAVTWDIHWYWKEQSFR